MMAKYLLATMAILGISFSASDAFAGRRCCRPQGCGCAAACAAPAPCCASAIPTDPSVPATAQAPVTNGYQSFSYEPGAAPAVGTAPMFPVRQPTSFYNQIRGDRKFLGNY